MSDKIVMSFSVPVTIKLNHQQLMDAVDALELRHRDKKDNSFEDSVLCIADYHCRMISVNLLEDGTIVPRQDSL